MLALPSLLKKPKHEDKEVQQFSKKVTSDRKELKALLDRRMQQAWVPQHLPEGALRLLTLLNSSESVESRRHNELLSAVLSALKSPNRPVQGNTPTYPNTKIANNLAYTSVANVTAASERLIVQYVRLDKTIADMRGEQAVPLAETIHGDLQEADRTLRMAARVAVRKVRKVLGIETGEADDDEDEDMEGDTLIEETEMEHELQRSLRYAERGVRRMVKGLRDEE
jgi:hypothetical protein